MRKIEFPTNVNKITKIIVDGTELETMLDPVAMKNYRQNKNKLPPIIGKQILDGLETKLKRDTVKLSHDEFAFIIDYAKGELGIS